MERERERTPPPPSPQSRPLSLPKPSLSSPLSDPSSHVLPSFTSSFTSFGLPQPRPPQIPTSPGASSEIASLEQSYPLFFRRVSPGGGPSNLALTSPTNNAAYQQQPFAFGAHNGSFRRASMLGSEPLLPPAQLGADGADAIADDEGQLDAGDEEDLDSAMIIGSPPFEQPSAPMFTSRSPLATRAARSRSITSEGGVPPSPVMIARAALHGGQKTPPPHFQRRLYNGMDDDGSTSSGSGSGMNNETLRVDGDEVVDDVPMLSGLAKEGGSGSGSGSEEGRVVRRPVSRKPNLLPKPKSHLRVLSQLRAEDGPADSMEILSENTLHRLSRSGASTVPALRSSTSAPPSNPQDRPPSSHGGAGVFGSGSMSTARPTPNRFPEQVEEDDAELGLGGSSSGEEIDDVGEAGSDWGGMSMGYGTEEEEERKASSIWTIRGSTSIPPTSSMAVGKSPGSERRIEMDTSSAPTTPVWQSSTRPGKRKLNDETRFEPYSQAFKRRAVSPASGLSPGMASPILPFNTTANVPTPPPLSMPMPLTISSSSSSSLLPISIPSPTLGPHHTFFSSINMPRSRAGSPAPSSLSSSAGRGPGFLNGNFGVMAMGKTERDEAERVGKMGEAGDGLGRMSLG